MAKIPENNPSNEPDESYLETILQRIFLEDDPVAHRTAIWDLFQLSGDWELFEKVSGVGGEKSIINYFQNILDYLDENPQESDDMVNLPVIPFEDRNRIRDLYAMPAICLRRGDWAGSATAMHEILLTEIFDVYDISEEELSCEDATAEVLKKWVSEDVLFPLSIIEYLAYSDRLAEGIGTDLLENYLAIMLTLFFSAQAHMDVGFPGSSSDDSGWSPN
ncbi:MAG: hypothetical protein NTW14_14000 [bacterium]|nr:hypothetical protein [bacterium]